VTELLLLVARRTSLEAKRERPDLSAMQVPRRRLRGAEVEAGLAATRLIANDDEAVLVAGFSFGRMRE
jgi:hypothetical protein